jgi:hypothetical protein
VAEDPTKQTKAFEPPDKIDKDQGSMPEATKLFSPGEIAPVEGLRAKYGYRLERLPQHYQDVLKNMCQKIAERDLFARIDEILRAAEQRFYWRSMFDVYFNEQNYVWELPNQAPWREQDSGDTRLSYAFNIFQQYGRGFISQVGQIPNILFEATNLAAPNALKTASSANAMKRKVEAINDIGQLSKDTARLFYTDGRVCHYSRWVTDGAKFGYEDRVEPEEVPEGLGEGSKPPKKTPRKPRGGEKIDVYGVLETRVPITMRDISQFPFLQLSFEIDLTTAKAMYPHISENISGGASGPGEYEFDTVTRIAINQGLRLLTQTGDTVHQIPTWQRTWMRPAMYAEIDDPTDRLFFEENFPDGVKVAFVGDTYAESCNESMDDHWVVSYPIEGDGQQTPSCGYPVMAVQDALCDLTDLFMETFMKAIPAIYCDKGVINLQAISKQKAGPGAHWPTTRALAPEEDMRTKMWAEPSVALPPEAMPFYQLLLKDIPQGLTGLHEAVLGSSDPNDQTKGGILALQDASKGYQGPAWRSWQSAYAKALEQLVRLGAYFRSIDAEDGKLQLEIPGGQTTEIDLEDLRPGSYSASPESDQNMPQTFEDSQRMMQGLVTAAENGFQPAAEILSLPKMKLMVKKYLLPPDSEVPGAIAVEKQMSEIQQMLNEPPIPNMQAFQQVAAATLQAQVSGQPAPPPPPPDKLLESSVKIDPEVDDNQTEAQTCQDWMNSPEGQQAKRDNPQGYMNIRLHFLAHKQAAQQQQMDAAKTQIMAKGALASVEAHAKESAKPPKPGKTPSETINFKDAGPHLREQIAAQAGLDASADSEMDAADRMAPHIRPTGGGAPGGGAPEGPVQ